MRGHPRLGIHWFNTTISDPFVHVAGRTADGVVHALKFTTKSGRSKEYGFITGPKVKKGNVFDLDLGKGLVGASGTAGAPTADRTNAPCTFLILQL